VNIGRIIVYGNAGNDTITINSNAAAIDAVLYGGDANDTITGGAGATYIDGGDGNDLLTAVGNRDILIGGPGQDTLNAGHDDDILIGGTYKYSWGPRCRLRPHGRVEEFRELQRAPGRPALPAASTAFTP